MLNNLLELKTRERIFNIIKEKPGIFVRELQRETNFSIGQLTYHLSLIVKANLVKEFSDNRFRRFYTNEIDEYEMRILSLLRQSNIRNILALFLTKNKITNKELSMHMDLSKSTISWHLQNLKSFNLINGERKGSRTFYSLKNRKEIRKIMMKYRKKPCREQFDVCSKLFINI